MNNKRPVLLPYPKALEFTGGVFNIQDKIAIFAAKAGRNAILPQMIRLKNYISQIVHVDCSLKTDYSESSISGIFFNCSETVKNQGYEIKITPERIEIAFSDAAGSFYAVCTVKQLLVNYQNEIPCMVIKDYPDFSVRGAMLDISRNKIPSMKTLYRYIDFLSSIKINQLQLYMEGFSFAYPSFREYWKDMNPVTGEEIVLLEKYCSERFIELVPSINCFGHMHDWLEKREIRHMAESPYGYDCAWGNDLPPATLNPQDPDSFQLVEKIFADIAPYFSSEQFNVGCDETMELGQGKSRDLCEKQGRGKVYYDYVMKIYNIVKRMGRKMMFWGDIIIDYPEMVKDLPKDISVLEWGYEANHPFEEHCRKFKESGIPYYVCPGTSSWRSITGRSENMRLNLLNAAKYGLEYDAKGYLITDWGDEGHWQYMSVSFAGFSFGAALAWNFEGNSELDVADFLNMFVFKDKNNIMGRFVLDCGNYYLIEKEHEENAALVSSILLEHTAQAVSDVKITEDELIKTKEYIDNLSKTLNNTSMACEDSQIILEEYETSLLLIQHGIRLGIYDLKKQKCEDFEGREDMIFELLDEISRIKTRHIKVWNERNRLGGLEKSLRQMYILEEYYGSELKGCRKKARRVCLR